MTVGESVPTKFIWLLDNVELVGTVYKLDPNDDSGPGDSVGIIPDPNYQHLIRYFRGNNPLPWERSGTPGLLHCETYDELYLSVWGGINHNESWPLQKKPDGAPFEVILRDGSRRRLQVGDHVKVVGRWVIDHHPEYCSYAKDKYGEPERCRYRGELKVGQTHTELHPFDWQRIYLVEPLEPGESTSCRVSLAAPLYEEQYVGDWKWVANELAGVAGHVFIDDQQLNYHTTVSARIQIDASPVPAELANAYRTLEWEERIIKLGQNMRVDDVRTIIEHPDGIEVQATIIAQNPDGSLPSIQDPAHDRWVFQAEYNVRRIIATEEVSCVSRSGSTIYGIQSIGGVWPDGTTSWKLSSEQAVTALRAGYRFYVTGQPFGERVEVVLTKVEGMGIGPHRPISYLTTVEPDGGNSLLALPQCPSFESAPLSNVESVTLTPNIVVCGESSIGTVTLNRPSISQVVVNLFCDAPGFATVPAQVTIPPNTLSMQFVITTPDFATTFKTAHAEIYAYIPYITHSGSVPSAQLTVKPRVIVGILKSLTLSPSTVIGGVTSRGTVTLEEAVPIDTSVGLWAVEPADTDHFAPLPHPGTGSESSIARVPPSVVIPAQQTSAMFNITTTRVAPETTETALIEALAGGVARYATLRVTD
jgi:hypothetical protein